MANSGTVTAGSAALASQYNNLRADVLDTTTGHVHDGTTDGGARIEGTAIKSTGATSGYLLTAGAGGTTTTWTAPTPGASVSYATATFVWGSQSTLANTTYVMAATTTAVIGGVTGQGTVLASVTNAAATSRAVRTYNINVTATSAGSVAAIGAQTLQPAVAGTVAVGNFIPLQTHFSSNAASTAVYFLEKVDATTTGNDTVTLRKYNRDLTTNIWNATLNNNITTFNSWSGDSTVYASEADCFVGFTAPTSTTAYGTVFAVNASTGSAFAAVFGTGTFSANVNEARLLEVIYVPGVAGADGTVHAFGTGIAASLNVSVHAAYTLNSTTGLTFVSFDTTNYFYPYTNTASNTGVQVYPQVAFWDNVNACIVLVTNDLVNNNSIIATGYDRTLSTRLFWNHNYLDAQGMRQGFAIGDPNHPWRTTSAIGGGHVYMTGVIGDYYFPGNPVAGGKAGFTSPAGVCGFAGAGSPTHYLSMGANGGTITAQPLLSGLRISDVATIAGTSTKSRMLSLSPMFTGYTVAQIAAKDSYLMTDAQGILNSFLSNSNPGPVFPMLVADSGTVGMRLVSQDTTYTAGTITMPIRVVNIG